MSLSKPQVESQPGSYAQSSRAMAIGSDAEFEALFRAHYASLCAFASRMVGSRAVAEELVQEVFLYLWEHRATWSAHTSVRTYLFTATRNITLNYLRREKLAERATQSDEGTIALFTRTQLEIEREVALAEFERAVKRAVALLPAMRRGLRAESRAIPQLRRDRRRAGNLHQDGGGPYGSSVQAAAQASRALSPRHVRVGFLPRSSHIVG